MRKKIAIVIYYTKENRYSYNALLGALENLTFFDELEIFLCYKKEELFSKINDIKGKYEKVIILLSFFTTQLWEFREIIGKIREIKTENTYIVAGGPHPTGDPYGVLKMGCDYVAIGEGEELILKLVGDILAGKDIGDLILKSENKFVDLDKFNPFSLKFGKFGPIEITRGCPFMCFYCQTPNIFGVKVRHRSVEKICELVEIMNKRNLKDIRFITPNAFSYGSKDGKNINLKEIERLLENIRRIIGKSGKIYFGTFPSEVRPEHVNDDTIRLIKEYTDNDNLVIGAQSGSPRILKLINRGHTVDDVYNAVEIIIKNNLKANVDIIFGLPYEEEEDIKLTIKLILDLTKMGAKVHAHTFMPLPQTFFEKMPAGEINNELLKTLNKLIPKGLVFGNWKKQEELGKKIEEYLKTKT